MAPKHKGSDAGNVDMPETSCKVLPLNEKVQVLYTVRKVSYAEVASNKNESSIREIVKKKKQICISLLRQRLHSHSFYYSTLL